MVVLQSIFEVFWAFGGIFFYCEIGERTGQLFAEVDDAIGANMDWYLFPEEVKRMLPTAIINVQQPIEIACIGSISCCRDSFKQVRIAVLVTKT